MARMKKKQTVEGFPEKWGKLLNQEWIDEVDALKPEDAKKLIIESENSIRETEREREADEKLKAAKADAKLLGSSYTETIKYQTAKIKYVLHALEVSGKA